MEILVAAIVLPGILYLLAVTHYMAVTMLDVSVLILFICVIRGLFRKRIRGGLMYSLWLLVPIRFLFSPFLIIFGDLMGRRNISDANITGNSLEIFHNMVQSLQSDHVKLASEVEPARLDLRAVSLPVWFWCVWVLGIAVVYLWSVYVNETFRHKLFEQRIRVLVDDCQYPVYKVPGIMSSCVMKVNGKKGIYLTEAVAEDEEKREYVLTHEICHLKHRDLFWGNLRCIVLACNWFNPLIWVAASLSKRDGETACDERSIRVLGEAKRHRYGRVLVDMVPDTEQRNGLFFTATTMGGGKRELVYRVCRIAESRNRWFPNLVVLAFALFLACLIGFAPSSADLRGLTPEETVRQYLYYWNQSCQEGMIRLRTGGGSFHSHGTVTVRRYGKSTEVKDYVDMDESWKKAVNKWADVRRLSLEIQIEYKNYDLGSKEPSRERSVQEFIVVKKSMGDDWKILETTLDDFCDGQFL